MPDKRVYGRHEWAFKEMSGVDAVGGPSDGAERPAVGPTSAASPSRPGRPRWSARQLLNFGMGALFAGGLLLMFSGAFWWGFALFLLLVGVLWVVRLGG